MKKHLNVSPSRRTAAGITLSLLFAVFIISLIIADRKNTELHNHLGSIRLLHNWMMLFLGWTLPQILSTRISKISPIRNRITHILSWILLILILFAAILLFPYFLTETFSGIVIEPIFNPISFPLFIYSVDHVCYLFVPGVLLWWLGFPRGRIIDR